MPEQPESQKPVKRPTAAEIMERVIEEEAGDLPEEIRKHLLDLCLSPAGRASKFKDLIKKAIK